MTAQPPAPGGLPDAQRATLADAEAAGAAVVEGAAHAHRPIALRHYLWVAGAATVVALALHWLGPVLTPFLVGAILAYLGTPLVAALERHGIGRGVGTTLAVLAFCLAIAALFVVLIPLVRSETSLLGARVPELADRLQSLVAPWLEASLGIRLAFDWATLRTLIAEHMDSVRELGGHLASGVRTGGALLVAILVNLALIPVVMFYVLRDWNVILSRADDLVPRRWQGLVHTMAREVDAVLAEFLRGQLLVMLALAAYYALALSLVGLGNAIAIGVLTGLLVFIPYVGFGLGLVLGVVAALLQWSGLPFFLAVLAVYGAGQLLENYVLVP
ncbi:MAG: AI-2E family transporter, partial [Betaproteobacteria bacterium]|nr:AI-2E family transporter [Betaproteobacteria bacterium]